jgi:LPS sulfotransferase NodH
VGALGVSLSIVPTPLNEVITSAARGAATTYDPSSSPLHQRAVFLVGAPRSGTTWLHQLLAVHPHVATSGESHVFCEGFGTLFANHDDTDPHMNLSTWVSRAELLALTRRFVDELLLTVRDRSRPAATHVLDKTPDHRPHAALLGEVYPDATFVHIIRDGRDMASSAHSLWSGFGADYRHLADAARIWTTAITDIRQHLSHLRYHEVRYEDLVAEPAEHLGAVLEHIGLPHDDALVQAAVEFGRAPINVRPSDARSGVRKWGQLDAAAARTVAVTAGDLLVELGYATAEEMAEARSQRTLATTRDDLVGQARELTTRARARVARAQADRRTRRLREQLASVRDPGRRLAEGAVGGDASISTELAPAVTLQAEDGTTVSGTGPVAQHLIEACAGARVVSLDADPQACAVQLVDASGVRRLHRYYVRDGAVERIVLQ